MDPKALRATMLALFTTAVADGPAETLDNGHKVYSVRAKAGAVPFRFNMAMTRNKPADKGDPETRNTVHPVTDGRQIAEGNELLSGVASSTSQDWYGTEMSLDALEGMSDQMATGVSLFPRHGGFLDNVEWGDEIGRTIMGIIERADVAEPADTSEPGFLLRMQAELYTVLQGQAGDQARDLLDRVENLDQPIGLSIGGWFLDMRFITDEDGEVVRIIVNLVELDHVAVVRSPANPDSEEGLKILRGIAQQALCDGGQRSTALPVDPTDVQPGTTLEGYEEAVRAGTITPIDESAELLANNADNADTEARNTPEVTTPPEVDGDPVTRDSQDMATADNGDNGGTMDPELKAMLEGINAGVVALSARVETIESRAATPEPTPAPVETTDTGLEATVRKLTDAVASLAGNEANRAAAMSALTDASKLPYQRRGRAINPQAEGVEVPDNQKTRDALIAKMLKRCKAEDDSPGLAGLVQRSTKTVRGQEKSVFALRWKAKGNAAGSEGEAFREACAEGPDLLREICNESHQDGSLVHWIRSVGPQL